VAATDPLAPTSDALAPLTSRQRAVFALLAEGCATKDIARRLNLAIGTVKVHLAAIYRALGARSRLEAVARARGGFTLLPTLLAAGSRTAERLN
jgi:DNA-binding NarL/FixJ family response regulator